MAICIDNSIVPTTTTTTTTTTTSTTTTSTTTTSTTTTKTTTTTPETISSDKLITWEEFRDAFVATGKIFKKFLTSIIFSFRYSRISLIYLH